VNNPQIKPGIRSQFAYLKKLLEIKLSLGSFYNNKIAHKKQSGARIISAPPMPLDLFT